MNAENTLSCFYDYRLVVLSVVIAILAAYAALDLASRITSARHAARLLWLCGGAVAMGTGIWAMHYIGMEAFHLPIPVRYDWPTIVISLLAAIAASYVALYVVSRPAMGINPALAGSALMATGIAAMHYIGMAAMRLNAMMVYSSGLVALSVFIAFVISYIALRLTFTFKDHGGSHGGSWSRSKALSALIMGLAIPVMHYVGMAAVTFVPSDVVNGNVNHAISVSSLGLAGITSITLVILGLVFVGGTMDRELSLQSKQLANSRQQLQLIFDHMSDGIGVFDADRNVIQSNPAAARMLGLKKPDITHTEIEATFEILTPDGEPLPPDQWPTARAWRGQFLVQEELIIRRKDTGSSVLLEVTTTPICNEQGETIQVIVSYHDITESRQSSEARARLAAIVDSSQDAIIGKDDRGIVRSWNLAAQRIFGYTADEMIGRSILCLIPAGQEEEESNFLDRVKRGERIEPIETQRRRKDGKLIHVSLTISPIRDASGKVVGASKIARDITEGKKLERQLYQSQKMEALGELTGGIAHDFNNLLAVIIGNLSLLERLLPGQEKPLKFIRTAHKAAWRGADLIRRLLRFSTDEELNPTPTSLSHSIRNLLELTQSSIGPEIKITTHLDQSVPSVFVDPAGLESALLNLAVNARDAMASGGTLSIATRVRELDNKFAAVKAGELEPGPYACVSVTDTGCGMSPETLSRVFEPFYTTKVRGKGTGLGLSMVYGFAKQSGGYVGIYSELGYGTTVNLYLPLTKGTQQPATTVPRTHTTVQPGTNVLVVDDELPLLEAACAYLTDMGCCTFQATDAATALQVIDQHREIALVITDVIMPGGMNGVELVQQIRHFIPEIQAIYSSGFSEDALAERSCTVVDGFLLHKPYELDDLVSIVSRALDKTVSQTAPMDLQTTEDRTLI